MEAVDKNGSLDHIVMLAEKNITLTWRDPLCLYFFVRGCVYHSTCLLFSPKLVHLQGRGGTDVSR